MAHKFVIVRKPLGWFKEGWNLRKHRDELKLKAMGKTLRIRQIQPVICRSDGTVLDGWSRVLAAKLEGLAELDVIITEDELSESDIAVMQFVSAEQRSALTDAERWLAACELMQMNIGWSQKELGEALGLDASAITILLSPCKLTAECQKALMDGRVSLSVCYAISKATSAAEQLELLNLKLHGATRDEVDRVRKQKKASPATAIKRLKFESESVVVQLSGNFTLADAGRVMTEIGKEAIKAAGNGVTPGTFERLFKEERALKQNNQQKGEQ